MEALTWVDWVVQTPHRRLKGDVQRHQTLKRVCRKRTPQAMVDVLLATICREFEVVDVSAAAVLMRRRGRRK
jgi:hypothetical protein